MFFFGFSPWIRAIWRELPNFGNTRKAHHKNIMLRVASVAVTEAHARRRAAVAVSHALKLTITSFPRRLSTKEERQFANKLQDETLKEIGRAHV